MYQSCSTVNLLPEFEKFISATQNGRRRNKDGTKIQKGSIRKLIVTYKTLKQFSEVKAFPLLIRLNLKNNQRQLQSDKIYWKKFYEKFTSYLYYDLDCYDNYVGSVIKDIRTFFNYLVIERNMRISNHFKQFYVPHEEIQILVINATQLNYLIRDQEFEEQLRPVLKRVKDLFVIGCTVSLRYSDLIKLKVDNLEKINQDFYLKVQAQKTKIYTRIKLPNYAVNIFKKYNKRNRKILPYFNLVRLNIYLKELAEQAGWTNEVVKTREKKGIAEIIYKNNKIHAHFRFCDLISSHTMRRSAITTMLSLQMPEHLVRKISGHAANSKEFHKYVAISQNYLDLETDKVFEKLDNLKYK